jgi:hypothetical protein
LFFLKVHSGFSLCFRRPPSFFWRSQQLFFLGVLSIFFGLLSSLLESFIDRLPVFSGLGAAWQLQLSAADCRTVSARALLAAFLAAALSALLAAFLAAASLFFLTLLAAASLAAAASAADCRTASLLGWRRRALFSAFLAAAAICALMAPLV